MIKVFGGVIRAAAFLAGAATLIALAGATILGANPYLDLAAQFLGPLAWTAVLGALAMFVSRRIVPALGLAAIAAAGVFIVWPRPVIEACALGAATHRGRVSKRVGVQSRSRGGRSLSGDDARGCHRPCRILVADPSRVRTAEGHLSVHDRLRRGWGLRRPALLEVPPRRPHAKPCAARAAPRSQVAAEIAFPDGTLHLIGVHLTRPWPFAPPAAQARQTKMLGAEFADLPAPRLLIGDLNAVTWAVSCAPSRRRQAAARCRPGARGARTFRSPSASRSTRRSPGRASLAPSSRSGRKRAPTTGRSSSISR